MKLNQMEINHAFRHFTPDEMMYYFQYNEKYFEGLPDGMYYHKHFMTDGESVYITHFDVRYKVMDNHFIAKLKYIAPYEIEGGEGMIELIVEESNHGYDCKRIN